MRTVFTSVLTSKGQTTIPKTIRELLELEYHKKVDFIVKDNQVIIQKHDAEEEALLRTIKKCLAAGQHIAIVDQEVVEDIRRKPGIELLK